MLPASHVANKRNNTAINNIVVTKITDTKSPPMKKPRKIVQEVINAEATYPVSERKEIYYVSMQQIKSMTVSLVFVANVV